MAKRFWQTLWFKLAAGFLLLALAVGLGAGAYMKYRYFPQASYDTVPPELPEFQGGPRVLVFSKTNGYRHLEAIPAANALLQRLAQKNGWNVFVTENAAVHNRDDLGQFDLLVWANVSGDVLTTGQREVFQGYIETGGSVLALHATGGDPSYEWDWHPREFIRAQFIGHPMFPQFRSAPITVENRDHPSTRHLPPQWVTEEEWYSFEQSPRPRVEVLATVDEAEYEVPDRLAMGADHPVIWFHRLGAGTVYYSALGHQAKAYDDPAYQQLLEEAMRWLLERSAQSRPAPGG